MSPVLVLTVVTVVGSALAAHVQPHARSLDAWALLLLVVAPAMLLVVRGRTAVAVVGTVAAVAAPTAYVALGYPWGPFFVPLVVVVALLAGTGRRWLGRGAAVGALVAVLGATWLRGEPANAVVVTAGVAWLAFALVAGEAGRGRGERVRAARAARLAREQGAVASERLRIARELHDVLGHSLSAINVQAGVGLHLMDQDPEQARSALRSIRTSSGQALDEVRVVLGVLRADGEAPPRAPTESEAFASIADLVAAARAGGLEVTTSLSDLAPIAARASGDVGRTAHRLVQEALTNVRRHSEASSAVVTLAAQGSSVEITVHDAGPARRLGGPGPAGGQGLIGMRERVEASGGRLDVGPDPLGGFTVRALLPLRATP